MLATRGCLDQRLRRAASNYPETVIFRLITERGRPAVKITTSEEGSGLTIGAKGTTSSLTMKNEGGRERVINP